MATGIGGEIAWFCPSLDDAGNGTLTLNDLSGNGFTGTLTNMVAGDWVSDTGSGGIRALDFDGSNDYVTTLSKSLTINTSAVGISFSGWFYARASSYYNLFHMGNNVDRGFTIRTTSGNLNYLCNTIGKNNSAFTFSINTWVHFATVHFNNSLTIYLNGVPSVFSLFGNMTTTETCSIKIGQFADTSYFNGRVDDLRVFNRALSSEEVTTLITMRGAEPAPVSSRLSHIIVI